MITTYSENHRRDNYSQHSQLNHLPSLAKWLSVRLRAKYVWVRIPLLSLSTFTVYCERSKTVSFASLIMKNIVAPAP